LFLGFPRNKSPTKVNRISTDRTLGIKTTSRLRVTTQLKLGRIISKENEPASREPLIYMSMLRIGSMNKKKKKPPMAKPHKMITKN
jgi:hypothetical protein